MTEIGGRKESFEAAAFEDLEVFQRAYKASLDVHRHSLGFPAVEQRALADQVRRASKSICANLAEGFGRQGLAPADFRRFLVMAMGSADEMRVWCRYCLDLGYIDEATWRHWRQEYQGIAKMLQGLIRSVQQRVRSPISVLCPLDR
jgi:four helix bundle protein